MIEDEKKIQEMAQLGTMDCHGKDCIKCQQDHPHEICWPYRRAKIYYEEGYRKTGEVRKEVFDKLIEVSKNFEGVLPIGVLKAWAIEFGVEVEE